MVMRVIRSAHRAGTRAATGADALEVDAWRPPELDSGLRGIAQQVVDLGRPQQSGIDADVLLPIEPGVREGNLYQLPYRMTDAGRDHVVFGVILLQHQPHRA